MTERQATQLRLLADPGNPSLTTSEQEAIKAAFDERASLLAACEALLGSRVRSAEEEAALVAIRKAVARARDDVIGLRVIARLEKGGQP